MLDDEELKEEPLPDNLVDLATLLNELWESYHSTDGRKKKLLDSIKSKYNTGAKHYNNIFSKLRRSDKGPIVKLIK